MTVGKSWRYRKAMTHAASLGVAVLVGALAIPLAVGNASADTLSDEARYVSLINESRVAEGLKPLAVHSALVDAARSWAGQMQTAWNSDASDICQISHNPNLRNAVAANWQKLGENVGCGDVDVDELERKFMESPRHRANIMDPSFDSVGIGIVMKGDVMFVTQQFMQQRSSTPAGATAAPAVLALTVITAPKRVPTTTRKLAAKTTTKRRLPVKRR